MAEAFGSLLGGAFVLWWLFAIVLAITIGFAYPLLALSAVRNIKGIRSELARLNDNLERMPTPRAGGSPNGSSIEDAPLYVPGTYTRTGPLDIR